MSRPALHMKQVSKSYGKIRALQGLDLTVPRGVICGLVGPNGAGKTTTFGIVGGLVRPDGGEVDLLGDGPFSARHVGRVTLLPQDCELNPHTPVRELLRFYARLQGLSAADASREVERALEEVALADRADSKIRQLSHGMRRRVAVAQALLGSPELVLLDEPTSGLDPDLVARMRDVFRSWRGRSTLVISSHVLSELEQVCDYVIFMDRGRCAAEGTLEAVTGRRTALRISLDAPPPLEALRLALPEVEIQLDGLELTLISPEQTDAAAFNRRVLRALLDAGAGILELRRGQSLEATWLSSRGSAHSG